MDHGANVNDVDRDGLALLLLAVGRSHTAIALVRLHAPVHARPIVYLFYRH